VNLVDSVIKLACHFSGPPPRLRVAPLRKIVLNPGLGRGKPDSAVLQSSVGRRGKASDKIDKAMSSLVEVCTTHHRQPRPRQAHLGNGPDVARIQEAGRMITAKEPSGRVWCWKTPGCGAARALPTAFTPAQHDPAGEVAPCTGNSHPRCASFARRVPHCGTRES